MTSLAMTPIRYNRRQVALMVTVAVHFNPTLSRRSASAILEGFGLYESGRGYVWNPR